MGAGDAAELSYLRQRVRVLAADNRALRRQALRAQLASAAGAGAGAAGAAGSADAGSLPAAAVMVAGLDAVPATPAEAAVTATPDAAVQPAPAAPVAAGAAATTAAAAAAATTGEQQQAPAVAPASPSALHALKKQLRRAQATLATLQDENARLMDMSNALRSERDRLVVQLAAAGLLPAGHSAPAAAMQPSTSALSPSHGAAAQQLPAQPQFLLLPPQPGQGQFLQAPQAGQGGYPGGYHPGGPPGWFPSPSQRPASARDGSRPPGLPPPPRGYGYGSPDRYGPSTSNGTYYQWPVAGRQASGGGEASGDDEASLELQGTMMALNSGGKFVPGPLSASSRETASQKAKLRALQKRREVVPLGAPAAAAGSDPQSGNRPKVRNYNIKDDPAAAISPPPGSSAPV